MKNLLASLVLLSVVACNCIPNAPEKPSADCVDLVISSQSRAQAINTEMVEAMVTFLSQMTIDKLSPTTGNGIKLLDATMRQIFLDNREIRNNTLGQPQPITAGAGFGTSDVTGQAKNLFGIYQGNTPSGVCNYPFAPKITQPIDPDDYGSDTVPYIASGCMTIACMLLQDCTSMQNSLFLNICNEQLFQHKRKNFYDNGLFDSERLVFQTLVDWKPGGTENPDANWVKRGWENYHNGDMGGHYVVYLQSDMNQYVLLYYKPFEDVNGSFAGTAYSFLNLHEEYLANDQFSEWIDDGICPAQPRNCEVGEL